MLKHVSFVTGNADATLVFYTSLGAVVSKDLVTGEGFRRVVLSFEGGGKLQFFEWPRAAAQASPNPAAQTHPHDAPGSPAAASELLHSGAGTEYAWMEHVALYLPDLKTSVDRLKAQGVTFSRELTLSPGGNPMAFVLDPDGRQVELLQQGLSPVACGL